MSTQTVYIRLAGIDAPEMGHFGRPGQPFAVESREELQRLVDGRTVRVRLLFKDQYKRAVAAARVWRWGIWPVDVSLHMVRKGLAVLYTQVRQGPCLVGSARRLRRVFLMLGTRAVRKSKDVYAVAKGRGES